MRNIVALGSDGSYADGEEDEEEKDRCFFPRFLLRPLAEAVVEASLPSAVVSMLAVARRSRSTKELLG